MLSSPLTPVFLTPTCKGGRMPLYSFYLVSNKYWTVLYLLICFMPYDYLNATEEYKFIINMNYL